MRPFFNRFKRPPAPAPAPEVENEFFRDWGDAGIGPNRRLDDGEKGRSLNPRIRLRSQLIMDENVAHRFNAYATAAFPREIGGLLRVVEDADGGHRVVDVRIFPHIAASGGYFELDGASVAAYNLELAMSGRKDEIPQWCSLVHSHPGMTPFLSGTDHENLVRLAGRGHAYSVICAAKSNPTSNYFAWHYAQAQPVAAVLCDFALTADKGVSLSGTASLNAEEIKDIGIEVREAFAHIGFHRRATESFYTPVPGGARARVPDPVPMLIPPAPASADEEAVVCLSKTSPVRGQKGHWELIPGTFSSIWYRD